MPSFNCSIEREKPMVLIGIVLLVVFGLLFLTAVGIFNGLVGKRNRVKNAWSQIDVQLKRRHDLIPNLVNTVKGYMQHEKDIFEKVAEARNQAISAGNNVQERAQAENVLTSAMRSLFAVAEAYPDLKANQNMMALQEELGSTENKIAFARQFYNDAVMEYNTARETFPSVIFANMFGFQAADSFQLDDVAAREAPQVQF